MGSKQSSEAKGIKGCAGCKVRLPPANPDFDFVKACDDDDDDDSKRTYCFWTKAESPVALSGTVNVGVNGKAVVSGISGTVQTTVGERLFKYFRIYNDKDYWCSQCFAIKKPEIAASVFLELSGKGKIISKEMNLVHMGSQ